MWYGLLCTRSTYARSLGVELTKDNVITMPITTTTSFALSRDSKGEEFPAYVPYFDIDFGGL
jgi:hypothetical protein